MTEFSYGVVDSDILKSYDGLGFLKAIIAGIVPQPPISKIMGFHLTEAAPGRAVFEGLPEFGHYNPIGSVHGGFAATLLEFRARLRDFLDAAQRRCLDNA